MKQTAVEWFKEELEKQLDFKAVEKFWGGLYDKAKEMEKEQIINTWTEATTPDHEIGLSDASYIISQIQKAEQYYNERFKSK